VINKKPKAATIGEAKNGEKWSKRFGCCYLNISGRRNSWTQAGRMFVVIFSAVIATN